jgi:copper resistance protein D
MTEAVLIGARALLMISLALLMGLTLFWVVMGKAGSRPVIVSLTIAGLAFSMLWLLASAAAMADASIAAPDWTSIWVLLTMTPIGSVLAVRGAALACVLALAFAGRDRIALAPAAIATATLAWTGHAGATEGWAGVIHRVADVAHIWAAAGWLGALAVLLHAIFRLRQDADVQSISRMLSRFSLMGTLLVTTLIVSGVINLITIVELSQLLALADNRYGWLLGGKLALFGLMLGLAAANRWRLTPALDAGGNNAVGHLRVSLCVETSAAIMIVGLVAWLGTLDPTA